MGSKTNGDTALYDAVVASADKLARHGKQRKQVLLIITDGADNASRLTLAQAIHRVQMLGGPVVYAIGMLFDTSKAEAQQTRNALEMLSQGSGGVAYFLHSMQDAGAVALEVARGIRNQQTIGYHSTNPVIAGDYHVVHVEAAARKHGKLIVRTRKRYLTKKQVHPQPQALQIAKQ